MASPVWLQQEVQQSTSQVPLSGFAVERPSGAALTPTGAELAAAAAAAAPISDGSNGGAGDSREGSLQPSFDNTPSYVVPAELFAHNVLPNAKMFSGASQQSLSGSSINSSPSGPPFMIQPPVPGPVLSFGPSFSFNIAPSSGSLPGSQKPQSRIETAAAVSLPFHSPNSAMPVASSPNLGPSASQTATTPAFIVPSGLTGTPRTPAPPGLVPSVPMPHPPAAVDSAANAVQRTSLPAPLPSNPVVQQQMYHSYPSYPAMGPSPQGPWLQPPQMGSIPRPPILQYPAVLHGPLPSPIHGIPHPSVSVPDAQPPGVSPVGIAGSNSIPPTASFHQSVGALGMQTDLPPPGIDTKNHPNNVKTKTTDNESLDSWTAHRTETGVIYYYNAVTQVSTYEKPPGFKGESEKVPVQPTPVSMENLPGTDWALVTTNDGKKYYYNSKTKLTSWQVPTELTELKKKQETDLVKEQAPMVTDKGSAPISLSAPAVNTGGREATALRTSALGGSSALDLIKKKLQDPGAPVTASPPSASGVVASELNGSRAVETTAKGSLNDSSKDWPKDANGNGNVSDGSSDSEDEERGPTEEERIIQFKEMLKERGVAPFSKWEKELPKIIIDPRYQAIPSHSLRKSLFEHYVKTRAEEERKEKRAALKAAIEGFKQLLEEASEDIDHNTDYQTFRKKRGNDPRFKVLDRKDQEHLLNERVLPLKKAAQEKAQAERAAAAASFKSMLRDKPDITVNSRWSRVKDSLRNDPRYKSVDHEDREALFNEYLSELRAAVEQTGREEKAKREEQEKLKERERELRKRKEREEQEMERVRVKVRRKEAVASFQALLVEKIKDPQASWTESKPILGKDPQGRATNPDLDPSDTEKLFRERVKMLHERCTQDFKALLAEVMTAEAATQKTEDGKTILDSWSTAKRLLKPDPRYNKMPRRDRETLWRRHAEDMLRKQKPAVDQEDKHTDTKGKGSSTDSGRHLSGSRRTHDRR